MIHDKDNAVDISLPKCIISQSLDLVNKLTG